MLDVLSVSGGYVKADKKTAEQRATLHFGQHSDAAGYNSIFTQDFEFSLLSK